MQGLEVGAIVDHILAAFGNATDIFKHVNSRSGIKKVKKASVSVCELQLQETLSNGPVSIRSQFDQNVARHGKSFLVGDAHTQSRLARTLLELNNGLLEFVNLGFAGTLKSKTFSTQKLLSLLMKAFDDTTGALRSLGTRLAERATVDDPKIVRERRKGAQKRGKDENKLDSPCPQLAELAELNPLLMRGGWIRTKSGSSIAVSAEGARKRAAKKSSHKQVRASTTTSVHKSATTMAKRSSAHSSIVKSQIAPQCSCQKTPEDTVICKDTIIEQDDLPAYEKQRPPSLYLVTADFFQQHHTTVERLPPRPPKIPLHARPNPNLKPRPVSGLTFLTTSTKIGEIPEHKVSDYQPSEEELRHRPLPYVIPPPLIQPPSKQRKGFWRFKLKA